MDGQKKGSHALLMPLKGRGIVTQDHSTTKAMAVILSGVLYLHIVHISVCFYLSVVLIHALQEMLHFKVSHFAHSTLSFSRTPR